MIPSAVFRSHHSSLLTLHSSLFILSTPLDHRTFQRRLPLFISHFIQFLNASWPSPLSSCFSHRLIVWVLWTNHSRLVYCRAKQPELRQHTTKPTTSTLRDPNHLRFPSSPSSSCIDRYLVLTTTRVFKQSQTN